MKKSFIEVKSYPITSADEIIDKINYGQLDKDEYGLWDGVDVKFHVWVDSTLFAFEIDLYGIHLIEFNLNSWRYQYDLVPVILQTVYDWSYKKTQDKLTSEYCLKQAKILRNKLHKALKDKEFIETKHPCW